MENVRLAAHAGTGIRVALQHAVVTHSPHETADRPAPGDFLIHQVAQWAGVLLVGLDRDDPELSCQTYQAAVAHATRAAASSNVDVWHTTDGACFERLASYRAAPSSRR